MEGKPTNAGQDWLDGGGEMAKTIRALDWSQTPLGPIESWPQSLRTTVSLCLASNFPISLAWGAAHTQIYNDGYWPICGAKHPHSMGQDFSECWASAWPAIGEAFERALAGQTSFLENQRMFLDRNGYLEETFFTFSFSPIRDESGGVGGLFHPVTETTSKMLAERRTRALRDLAARIGKAQTVEEALSGAAQVLSAYELDLPFVLLYELDGASRGGRLVGSAGLAPGSPASQESIQLNAADEVSWPLMQIAAAGEMIPLENLEQRFGPLACGPYPESPKLALAAPIIPPGGERPAAIFIAGVSSRLPFNDLYRGFCEQLAATITTAVANALAYETERKRAEALAEIDRAKTLFFSNVSHEFRTPLMLMLGPLEEVRDDGGVTPEQRERLDIAHRNSLRLLKLVNALLDFSRLEAGRIVANYEPVDLAAFTAELASMFQSAIESAGLELVIDCPRLPEPVYVDRDMWEKIVLNLLSNAFKFTERGRITVSQRIVDGSVQLAVEDTGTGIQEDQLHNVFKRFYRIEGARGRTYEGTGIGLALVQELARLHGGAARVQSVYGRGSTFTVTIPLGKEHLPQERVGAPATLTPTTIRAEAFVQEALRWLPDHDPAQSETPQEAAGPEPDGPRPRVLLADDNADMRAYVRKILAGRYEVTAVHDGAAALAAARRQTPDLILSDVMMPRLDGFGLLRELRADPATQTIPVILLSARAGEESRVEGLDAGADDYLVKPFSGRELLARMSSNLELARVRREATRREQETLDAIKLLESVRESEARFRTMANAIPQLAWIAQADGYIFWYNQRWYEYTGTAPEQMEGWGWQSVHDPAVLPRVMEQWTGSIATGQPFDMTFPLRGADGVFRPFLTRVLPLRDEGGRIVQWFGTNTDVTEQKRAEEALRAANTALAEADRRKDEFLAMLAHELRNPLAPVRNAVQVLRLAGAQEAVLQRQREIIDRQVTHMARLVDDLLDVSRMTRGLIELKRKPVYLADVLAQAVETVTPLIEARRQTLSLTLPTEDILLSADPDRLIQTVGNLLANAVKFTDEGGRIWLKAGLEAAEAVIRVRDNGAGIAPEILPHVFDIFAQADQGLARTKGGLGIGLTMVRRLVEMHGGVVEARSEGDGQGSEFIVHLPALPGNHPPRPSA